MNERTRKNTTKSRRKHRTRVRVKRDVAVPRMSVLRTLTSISAQLIDDKAGKTLVSVHSREVKDGGTPVDIATKVGALFAEKAKEMKVSQVVFDRGAYLYHGRVKALADGARKAGLKI